MMVALKSKVFLLFLFFSYVRIKEKLPPKNIHYMKKLASNKIAK